MADYAARRDQPGADATSGLSPHLHFGEIGPRQVWAAVQAQSRGKRRLSAEPRRAGFSAGARLARIRASPAASFPATPAQPLRREFAAFPWRQDAKQLRAWQRGLTGYPIVDAGMRQLWRTGLDAQSRAG
ncbi:MAG: FAD-binding domain-containing protein [Lacunisphaera sp.]